MERTTIRSYIYNQLVLKELLRQFNGGNVVFSINSAGIIIEYPCTKKLIQIINPDFISCTELTEIDLRLKFMNENYKTSRKKSQEKSLG